MKPWAAFYSLSFLILFLLVFPGASSSRTCDSNSDKYPDLYEASIQELQSGLDAGDYTSVDLVKAYLARINEVNNDNANLRAVIETNPYALEQAATLDRERSITGKRSPLHGIPILLKDNIATLANEGMNTTAAAGMNTTAGSYALLGSIVPDDATVAAKLRKAGAILLGKANLSEWSNIRDGGNLPAGWSARGGQGTNPYYPRGNPCGSSSGSAVAIAVGLAAGSLGTDTGGSIVCPASFNNIVGIKPTVGLTSRAGVIPVTSHQDTVGPMTRNVADAAAILSVIAGRDEKDNYTSTAPANPPDYTSFLDVSAIDGKRFGVPRTVFTDDSLTGNHPSINIEFNKALETIRSLGGVVVDPADLPSANNILNNGETLVFQVDLKVDLNRYLADLKYIPTNVTTLAGVIAFNDAQGDLEQPEGLEGQATLIAAESTRGYNWTYYSALRRHLVLGRTQGIDAVLKTHNLDALVLPSNGFASLVASLAGYPIVTVPLGFHPNDTRVTPGPHLTFPAPGIPFGLSFLGTAYSEPDLIGFAYAYEQHTQTRLERRAYSEAVPKTQLYDVTGVCPELNSFNYQD